MDEFAGEADDSSGARVGMSGSVLLELSFDPGSERTLLNALRWRAAKYGGQTGFIFLSHGETNVAAEAALSFGALELRARSVAAALQQCCSKGDRALITCAPGLDYIVAFYGCVMAGIVAVPAYPPRNARHMERLVAIAEDAAATVVLNSSALSGRLRTLSEATGTVLREITVDTVSADLADAWCDPQVTSQDLAVLQYTSGTVGAPKGIMVSHAQLLANADRIGRVGRLDTSTIGVYWVPPYHDMGLIAGLVLPVTVGCQHVLMSPVAFLQRPMRWLEALSRFRATHTSAPNFAYRMCAEQARVEDVASLDLASLRAAFCGAEVVRQDTLQAFVARFRASGFDWRCFRPAYGLAENVLLATCPDVAVGPVCLEVDADAVLAGRLSVLRRHSGFDGAAPGDGARTLVSCGRALPDHDIRIVDAETRHERRPVESARSGCLGRASRTATGAGRRKRQSIFRARLEAALPSKSYLRTGDLGAVLDGELYVLGRIKEMVIVRGRNLYATDLEATVSASHPALGFDRTIAFAMEMDGMEQVGIVHEFSRAAMRNLDAPALFQAIRSALVAEHEADPAAIVLVRPATLPRTSSGKLQRDQGARSTAGGKSGGGRRMARTSVRYYASRYAASRAYQDLADRHRGPRVESDGVDGTLHLVRDAVAALVGLPPATVRPDTPFDLLGIDFLAAVRWCCVLRGDGSGTSHRGRVRQSDGARSCSGARGGGTSAEDEPPLIADPAAAHEPFAVTDVQAAYLLGREGAGALGDVSCYAYGELRISRPRSGTAGMGDGASNRCAPDAAGGLQKDARQRVLVNSRRTRSPSSTCPARHRRAPMNVWATCAGRCRIRCFPLIAGRCSISGWRGCRRVIGGCISGSIC